MSAVARILDWPSETQDELALALWTAKTIAAATGGKASADFQVSGAEIDSRDVVPGDLFFALKGESMDGHRFVEAAFAKGAVAAVVDRPIDGPHVLVEDTSKALEFMARAARERTGARIIGVTGSVGKTGVKEAIYAAILTRGFNEAAKDRLRFLRGEPSTASLMQHVHFLMCRFFTNQITSGDQSNSGAFRNMLRLVLNSLMEDGAFARQVFEQVSATARVNFEDSFAAAVDVDARAEPLPLARRTMRPSSM